MLNERSRLPHKLELGTDDTPSNIAYIVAHALYPEGGVDGTLLETDKYVQVTKYDISRQPEEDRTVSMITAEEQVLATDSVGGVVLRLRRNGVPEHQITGEATIPWMETLKAIAQLHIDGKI